VTVPSFDVVSKINMAELDNALNQTKKEIQTRFDFQGTQTTVELAPDRSAILLKSSSEGRLTAAYEVLQTKLVKRGVSLRALVPGDIETTSLGVAKQSVGLQQGINVEKAKELIRILKDSKIKAQGSIQGDQLRITGKNRDDLQSAIQLFRGQVDVVKLDMQFVNFRD
jgi:uncharacterized protein YajQ (UPF0234 family)